MQSNVAVGDLGVLFALSLGLALVQLVVFDTFSFTAGNGLGIHRGGSTNVRALPYTLLQSSMPRDQFHEAFNLLQTYIQLTYYGGVTKSDLVPHIPPAAAAGLFLTRLSLLNFICMDQCVRCTIKIYDYFLDSSSDPEAAGSERGLRKVLSSCNVAGVLKLWR